MRKKMKDAAAETLQSLVNIGADVKFTKKELKELGVTVPEVKMSPTRIKKIRAVLKVSQAVFADLLSVSLSTVRQWEIGVRKPSGSTRILLEIVEKDHHALDYRMNKKVA